MPRHFTHYWKQQTCRWQQRHGYQGQELRHTASNLFEARGVEPGDFIYVVTLKHGQMILVARMKVDKLLDEKSAADYLRDTDLWEAADHAVAQFGESTPQSFDRVVPEEVAIKLQFIQKRRLLPLAWEAPSQVDRQTLRGVRELSEDSARLLDEVIADG